MSKPKIPDFLYLKHIVQFLPGQCFLCGKPAEPDAVVHPTCAIAYTDEKEKRRKSAWMKAEEECNNQKTS